MEGYRLRALPEVLPFLPPTPGMLVRREEEKARQMMQALAERPRPQIAGDFPVSLADRWYLLGMTGSGKTTFARRLVNELRRFYPFAHLYILDSKGGDDFAGWPGLVLTEEPPKALPEARAAAGGQGFVQVWQPPDDNVSAYDAWLHGILKARHPAIVYIDELSSLAATQSGTAYPIGLPKLLKQGRSLGISVITLTQEAAYIPRQIRTQTTHLVYFRLQEDRHGIAQAMSLLGFDRQRAPASEYGFFYRRLNPKPSLAIEYADYHEFFGD